MSHSTPSAAPDRRRLWIVAAVVAVVVIAIGGWLAFGRGDSGTGTTATPTVSQTPGNPAVQTPVAGAGTTGYAKDGACAAELPVKATDKPQYYYEQSDPRYASTKAVYCFATVDAAQQAGFTAAPAS